MNYIIINEKRYNLTDDGINQMDVLKLKIDATNHTFQDIKKDFENIDYIEIYGTAESASTDDFFSGFFENITLKSIEYDIADDLYIVTMAEIDETAQRIGDLEEAVNFLLMGGEIDG